MNLPYYAMAPNPHPTSKAFLSCDSTLKVTTINQRGVREKSETPGGASFSSPTASQQ
jgi:hypothetical protein